MNKNKTAFTLLSLLLLSTFSAKAQQSPDMKRIENIFEKTKLQKNYKEGEVLVKFKKDRMNLKSSGDKLKIESFQNSSGLSSVNSLEELNVKIFKSEKSTDELIGELKDDPNVEYIQPNFIKSLAIASNDPYYSIYQWALENTPQSVPNSNNVGSTTGTIDADIDASAAWDIEKNTNNEIVVAVIDTGMRMTHQDLSGNLWTNSGEIAGNGIDDDNNGYIDDVHGWDFKDNDNKPDDSTFDYCYEFNFNGSCKTQRDVSGHGTFISGIIAASSNNGMGISGMSLHNKIKIMPLRFDLDSESEIAAINYAKRNGAKVINASFGGSDFSQIEKDALESFGGIVSTAAGNDNINNEITHFYPSDFDSPNIISVAATDQNDALADFSNYGTTTVDLGAPGVNIASTHKDADNGYAIGDGTSFAAPFVTGAAAMLFSANNSLSTLTVKNYLLSSGDSLPSLQGKTVTGKRLNLNNALLLTTKADQPSPSYSSGTYNNIIDVSLTSQTPGASIFYTLDGSEPNIGSSLFSTPIHISNSTTIKAIALKNGMQTSDTMIATYNFKAASPISSLTSGNYSSAQSISLSSATIGSTILYTTDGTTPSQYSKQYTSAISITSTQTLKAIAIKAGMSNSDIFSATYNINIPPTIEQLKAADYDSFQKYDGYLKYEKYKSYQKYKKAKEKYGFKSSAEKAKAKTAYNNYKLFLKNPIQNRQYFSLFNEYRKYKKYQSQMSSVSKYSKFSKFDKKEYENYKYYGSSEYRAAYERYLKY